MKHPDSKDIVIFNPNVQALTPAQVIFYILEMAARESKFGVAGTQTLWHHVDIEDELNEYVERLVG